MKGTLKLQCKRYKNGTPAQGTYNARSPQERTLSQWVVGEWKAWDITVHGCRPHVHRTPAPLQHAGGVLWCDTMRAPMSLMTGIFQLLHNHTRRSMERHCIARACGPMVTAFPFQVCTSPAQSLTCFLHSLT